MRILPALLILAACGRVITGGEQQLVGEILGDTFDATPVRIHEASFIGVLSRTVATRPQTTCREKINRPPDGPTFQASTAGSVLWTRVLTNSDWTIDDYVPNYPEAFNLISAMFFAHEIVHVWQWQNRATTGYSPFRALAEHKPGADPYLLEPDNTLDFLDLGYEQQAVMVEEFICCRTVAPEGARTQRLYETLRAVMPVQHPSQTPRPTEVYGIYEDADLTGICS